jgi:predicted deacylase
MRSTPLATAVHVLDSGVPGAVSLVIAGIHGDEPAGVEAARQLAAKKLARGRMIVIPVANRLAAEYEVRTPYFMQDLNRSFPGRKTGRDTQRLAASIMEVIAQYRPAVAIDLHESGSESDPGGSETANSLILSEDGRAAEIALTVLEAMNPSRGDSPLTFLSGAPQGSFNREVARRFKVPVITVETSRHDPMPGRVETQIEIVTRIHAAIEGVTR